MNIHSLHSGEKKVSAVSFFKGNGGIAIALQIGEMQELKEHVSKVPALLICLEGEAVFEDENGISEKLFFGDYVNIKPMLKHKVRAIANSSLLLIK
ncbi:cupin domain-containing protein [Ekhidna sp.]